jgi:hypothetical protein
MLFWKNKLNADPIPWLLENDRSQPAIRYYTLCDLLGRNENENEVKAAKEAIMTSGPVPVILAAQHSEGHWGKPPRYTGTISALVYLAQFGADGADSRVHSGCEFLLSRYIDGKGRPLGSLSLKGTPVSGFNCTVGSMGAALIDLGWANDQRLQTALEWLAQTITGEGSADVLNRNLNNNYKKTRNLSPPFACSSRNADLPCAWGAIKTMIALSKVPPAQRTKNMQDAIKLGVDFLLSRDPAVADYPFSRGNKPSSTWFKFYYPLGSESDVLQNLEVLTALGQAGNPKLAKAVDQVISKQNQEGRWLLERTYKVLADTQEKKVDYWYHNSLKLYITGKELADIQERKGQPSKWVTLRALRVLKAVYP